MRRLFVAVIFILIVAFAAMYIYGSSVADNCVTIGGQKTCWKNYDATIDSPLCIKSPCSASSELQRHNAVVDAISAGCDTAKDGDFSDEALNKEIEGALKLITSYSVNARTLCSDPGIILSKKFYD